MTELKIKTNVYTGPLDLVFFLVRKAEVDIHDLPLAEIADQYVAELQKMEKVDLAFAGEYLVMAAQLVKLKSEMVLHAVGRMEAGEDPRRSLIQQLLEYKRLRRLSERLGDYHEDEARRYGRPFGLVPDPDSEELNLDEVNVYDLFRQHDRLVREITPSAPHVIQLDDRPIEEYIDLILEQLRLHGTIDFAKLAKMDRLDSRKAMRIDGDETSPSDKQAVIGNFLAMLELVRQQKIEIEQRGADIVISQKSANRL